MILRFLVWVTVTGSFDKIRHCLGGFGLGLRRWAHFVWHDERVASLWCPVIVLSLAVVYMDIMVFFFHSNFMIFTMRRARVMGRLAEINWGSFQCRIILPQHLILRINSLCHPFTRCVFWAKVIGLRVGMWPKTQVNTWIFSNYSWYGRPLSLMVLEL